MLLLLLFSQQAYVSLIERGIYWMLIEFLALVLFERVVSLLLLLLFTLFYLFVYRRRGQTGLGLSGDIT